MPLPPGSLALGREMAFRWSASRKRNGHQPLYKGSACPVTKLLSFPKRIDYTSSRYSRMHAEWSFDRRSSHPAYDIASNRFITKRQLKQYIFRN